MNEELQHHSREPSPLDAATCVGQVTLGVADLERMVRFYEQIIGLVTLRRDTTAADLGVGKIPLLRLELRPNGKRYPRATGLFHLALRLPSREELGCWLKHLVDSGYRLDGAGDHLVSEALYLSDPEGNGIELYRDRPRDTWEFEADGRLKMATLPVDLPALAADGSSKPFIALPAKTRMGHIHLQVDDVSNAVRFYRDGLGFDLMTVMPGAAFLSAGGYHHHLGLNRWNSKGADPPPPESLGLIKYSLVLPSEDERDRLVSQLHALKLPVDWSGLAPLVRDSAGNGVELTVSK